MTAPLDRAAVVAGYQRNCAELEAALAAAGPDALRRRSAGTRWSNEELLDLRMYFPTRWDPFFKETMTLADVYAYPMPHFDFHAVQLSLDAAPDAAAGL